MIALFLMLAFGQEDTAPPTIEALEERVDAHLDTLDDLIRRLDAEAETLEDAPELFVGPELPEEEAPEDTQAPAEEPEPG